MYKCKTKCDYNLTDKFEIGNMGIIRVLFEFETLPIFCEKLSLLSFSYP